MCFMAHLQHFLAGARALVFFKELSVIAQKAMEPQVHVTLRSCSWNWLVLHSKKANCQFNWSGIFAPSSKGSWNSLVGWWSEWIQVSFTRPNSPEILFTAAELAMQWQMNIGCLSGWILNLCLFPAWPVLHHLSSSVPHHLLQCTRVSL